ncbi:TniQ family protein [Streptomyces sp. NBC_01601]|uniref:TniQ family protein n=1 Tax=Streptomyces sp. NBC_01601 TaxID=2975892 RepID=UPI002E2B243A|nr:TniQ family protein [Streptomyces sp. NBC_01601]
MRAYKRAHPGITLDQARQAVAARAESPQGLPARIPDVPLPRPTERLESYVQRVAATVGVQRHRAMELLGLRPGTSATERLDHLAAGLPDDAVQALVAATGMTPDQAHALTTPPTAASRLPDLENVARQLIDDKHIQRGGNGKTRTDARTMARLLAEASGQRPLPIDTSPAPTLDNWMEPATRAVLVDLPWPTDDTRPPVDPALADEILKELGITPRPKDQPAQ